jgi:RNA polymerase sigma-70 factor (ECF subfamily)
MTNAARSAADAASDERGDASRHAPLNLLLREVGQGDRTAFAELYRQTSAKLFGVCLRMLRNRGEAEEVLQEVYTTVWRRAEAFDDARANAMTWLTTMARNRAIDRLRQHHEEPLDEAHEAMIPDEGPTPAVQFEQSQENRRLSRCIDALPPQHAHAIREAFYSGATYSELAERVDVPLGTMKSWIRRSLVLLKACLEQ